MRIDEIQKQQENHWAELYTKHNLDVKALGSETEVHKNLRYSKVAKVFEGENNFTILDIGAGFGNFNEFLKKQRNDVLFKYTGFEITNEFIKVGKSINQGIDLRLVNVLTEEVENFDFVVFSGLFHQPGVVKIEDWENFMFSMIEKAFQISLKGAAFNVLSSFVDFKREGNYYPDNFKLQEFLISKISRFIKIDQSYPLFETTYYIFHPEYIKLKYPEQELQKYIK